LIHTEEQERSNNYSQANTPGSHADVHS